MMITLCIEKKISFTGSSVEHCSCNSVLRDHTLDNGVHLKIVSMWDDVVKDRAQSGLFFQQVKYHPLLGFLIVLRLDL